jgi:hypothetical protein
MREDPVTTTPLPKSQLSAPSSVQWALEDQINELQKENYNAEGIAGQLKEFVQSFPQLQTGERKLLVDALIERVEVGQNKRVLPCGHPLVSGISPRL